MRPTSTSIYTFKDLIRGGYLYVDKTEYIYKLVNQPKGLYFLSRPRRFGKSLMLSTLKAFFLGQRDLFNGLALYDKPVSWDKYPIIHLDLIDRRVDSAGQLELVLYELIDEEAKSHGIHLSGQSAASRFHELITTLAARGMNVVILIDEYDKPIISNLDNPQVKEILKRLKAFYSVIKSTEPYQRFVLLTGVSKFSKVSVFSDLNNLDDLSMNADYATALGYTQPEFETYFTDAIDELAEKEGLNREMIIKEIREWYNGYRFHYAADSVYNPVSLMSCLSRKEFSNFWFETGTPTFLLSLMRNEEYDLPLRLNEPLTELAFSAYEVERLLITPLLVQTGYLTIKDSYKEGRIRFYRLGFPNREVEQAFGAYLIGAYSSLDSDLTGMRLFKLSKHLNSVDLDSFFKELHSFFAGVPNTISLKHEKYYQTILYITLRLLNIQIEVEVSTNIGRVDAILKTKEFIYILEFKLNGTAKEALNQITEKHYADVYQGDERKIVCVGVAFDKETRNIGEWMTE